MGRPQNPTHFSGDLRRSLLDLAADAVAEQGPAAVSLRELARRLGVSHAASAHHFGDKAGLFTALATEGWTELADRLDRAARTSPHPVKAIAAAGVAYVQFASERRGYFDVMFSEDLVDATDESYIAAKTRAYLVLSGMIEAGQAAGWARGTEPWVVETLAWSVVHGLAELSVDGPPGKSAGRSLDDVAWQVTSTLVAALATPAQRRRLT